MGINHYTINEKVSKTRLRLTEKAAVFLYGLDRKTIWEFQER